MANWWLYLQFKFGMADPDPLAGLPEPGSRDALRRRMTKYGL